MAKQDAPSAKKAIKLRERVKRKKPKFVRQESWRYVRLKENWRRPRGLDNKMRRKIKGWPPSVSVGYRGPKIARGLHPSGYKEVLVYNVEELKEVDQNTQAIRIAHTVGKRKRDKIITEARKRKMTILNLKEPKKEAEEEKELLEEKEEEKEPEKKEEATEKIAKEEKPKKPRKKTERRKRRAEKQ
jgi:large subunit ribosomal protein L32e